MKHENNIDNYFEQVKQNPPLMNIEKVHQIITDAETKVKAEAKKGHRNILKFTIMTTIFAVIVSAIIFWQGNNLEIPKDKNQITNTAIQSNSSVTDFKKSESTNEIDTFSLGNTGNKIDKNKGHKYTTHSEINKDTIASDAAKPTISNAVPSKQCDSSATVKTAQQVMSHYAGFVKDTIQPTDGSKFVLRLSKEELEKIGFQFTDTSIVFENSFDKKEYKYGTIKRKIYGTWKFDGKKRVLVDESGFNYAYDQLIFTNKEAYGDSSKNHFDYYPICTTNTLFTNYLPILRYNDYLPAFDMLNDTLLPIIFPSLDSVPEERIIWFVLTESLYNLLENNHKAVLDELIKYKRAKKYHRYKDLVIYKSPFYVDEAKVIKLGNRELEKLGFKFYDDSTIYHGRWSNYGNSMMSEYKSSKWSVRDDLPKIEEKEGSIALLVSDGKGSLLSYGSQAFLSFESNGYENIIPTLIPVPVKIISPYRDLVFWFLPTEGFFNALPDSIGNELRKEYNYITAEDKSQLEKPECKYFDECKNTLKVSSFKVYPNPASTNATVSFTLPEAITGRITLVDLAGRERQVLMPQASYAKGSHSISVDLSNVPEGIYLIALYSNKGIQTQRLIVAR